MEGLIVHTDIRSLFITILGSVFLLVLVMGLKGYSGKGIEEVPIPPCETTGGSFPFQSSETTCLAGMSKDAFHPPSYGAWISIEVNIEWSKSGAWVGITENIESTKCEDRGKYLSCDKNDLSFLAGGPSSEDSFVWQPSESPIRFVSGGLASDSLHVHPITYSWSAHLSPLPSFILAVIGIGLIGFAQRPRTITHDQSNNDVLGD